MESIISAKLENNVQIAYYVCMEKENIQILVQELLKKELLLQATLSSPRTSSSPQKITIRPILIKEKKILQYSYQYSQKIIHENVSFDESLDKILNLLKNYKQALFCSSQHDYHVLINKKGEATILKKAPSKKPLKVLEHNRQKNYLLQEGVSVPFLVELGVMSSSGKIMADKRDKFRQINRFLEMIDDVVSYLPKEKMIRIVDFGCGKAYLTFALYHYLQKLGYGLQITGLDLKAEVVAYCQSVADRLGFEHLRFLQGDINAYSTEEHVDIMVCLHACDTATDAAIEKAVRWKTRVILAVPCCQHELFGQIACQDLQPLLTHGILKERFSALATDAVRAHLLEILGYKTQILEFIDMEHTPKNLLIRAVRQPIQDDKKAKLMKQYLEFKQMLHITPDLEKRFESELKFI